MFRLARLFSRAVAFLLVCALLQAPVTGAAQSSPPIDPTGPFPATFPGLEAPEGAPNVCFSNYTGGASADFGSSNAQAVQNAINAASAGGTVKLAGVCAGVVSYGGSNQVGLITKTLTVIGGYASNNWVNSYPITQATILDAQGGGRVLQIVGATVSIAALTAQNGKVVSAAGGGIASTSALTLTNVAVYSSTTTSDGGGVSTSGVLRLIDTRLISNTAGQSGGGANSNGLMFLIGGLFERNVAQHGGGARGFGSVAMTGTAFLTNSASLVNFSGGGLKVDAASTLNGGLFQGNSGYDGGGLYGQGTASISGTHFISNTAARWGGGANVNLLTQITATTFMSNTSLSDCGALRTSAILRATASVFQANTTAENGGGACADNGAVVTGGVFQDNSGKTGGGLWANAASTVSGTAFLSNTASLAGGGAWIGGAAVLNGGWFQGNKATDPSTGNGAGLFANATLTASAPTFVENTAGNSGGGAYAIGVAELIGGLFQQNRANNFGGGGLFATALTSISGTQFLSNASVYGGAIYGLGEVRMTNGAMTGNTAGAAGGAADLESGGALTGTLVQDNQCAGCGAYGGGGVWSSGNLRVNAARFIGNGTGGGGGGLAFGVGYVAGDLDVVNALFVRNVAARGQAIAVSTANQARIVHVTIASPTLAAGSAINIDTSSASITNTIVASHAVGINGIASTVAQNYTLFFGNTADTAGTVSGGAGSGGGDPRFVDPAAGDYHLAPLSAARNTGVNAGVAVDADGDPRPIGGGFDIGFDETRTGGAFVPNVLR